LRSPTSSTSRFPRGGPSARTGHPPRIRTGALRELRTDAGGGLLPLGGIGELFGGHKGYGLAVGVDILTAVLSGAAFRRQRIPRRLTARSCRPTSGTSSGVAHRELPSGRRVQAAMDDYQRLLRSSAKQPGQDRIYIPGEKEYEADETISCRRGSRQSSRGGGS